MDNITGSNESLDGIDSNATNQKKLDRNVRFAVGAHSIDQSLFDDDEKELVSPSNSISHEEEFGSPVTFSRKSVYDEDMWWKTSELEGLGQYDDFHTIDWCRDRIRDGMRFRQMRKMKLAGTWTQKLKVFFYISRIFQSQNWALRRC